MLLECLTDFVKAKSLCEAEVLALKESLECVMQKVGCDESQLEIRSDSKILESWIKNDDLVFWDHRFTRNFFISVESWLKNVSMVHVTKISNKWKNVRHQQFVNNDDRKLEWFS